MRSTLLWKNANLLVKNHVSPSKIPCGFVPVDMDVTPCDNSKTKKEGVSRTCKGCGGYAPMMAYIGLELAMAAYNILRMIGDKSIGPNHPMKPPVKRRRIGTVIKNLVMIACHITRHARRTKLGLGRSNIWRKTFQKVYLSFSCL